MRSSRRSFDFLQILLDGALRHGLDSEPDHEVGDLQTFLIACWDEMTPEQRERALENDDVKRVLDDPGYEDAWKDY